MAEYDILIVGGGQAARRAAEGVRAVSPDLSVAIVGEEDHPPYDRPPLSKAALTEGLDACGFRPSEAYAQARVDLLLGRRVRSLDAQLRAVRTEDGDTIRYGRLILATGSRVRQLDVGAGLKDRILTLRTRSDAARLSARLTPGARVAIIGAGFIGLEVASSALARGARPVVIEAAERILARGLPQIVSDRLMSLHFAMGVDIRLSAPVVDIREAPDGGLIIETRTGLVEADVAVVGVGVLPNVELAVEAGLAVDNGLLVDDAGATSMEGVFGAGEVTRHPVHDHDERFRLESWQAAEMQAEAAGRAAAGAPAPQRLSPWFWSDQAGVNLQVLGHLGDAPMVAREYGDGSCVYFALDAASRLRGMVAIDGGRDISTGRRLLARSAVVDHAALADPDVSLRTWLS